jgi:endonuclease/exonuclease/phosphatase family metal-dependent hydrolase
MKIMTWNIWGGKNLPEVTLEIKKENPDIVGLQEVKGIDGKNSAEIIASDLGYFVFYCKSFTTDRHTPSYDLGNAILSKIPFTTTACHFLSTQKEYEGSAMTEPRTAAEVNIQGSDITFITTHLGYSKTFEDSELRLKQLSLLLQICAGRKCVLMGDFNSTPDTKTVKTLEEYFENTDLVKDISSFTDFKEKEHPRYRIDYIFVSKEITTSNFTIGESKASDHNPLSVIIEETKN